MPEAIRRFNSLFMSEAVGSENLLDAYPRGRMHGLCHFSSAKPTFEQISTPATTRGPSPQIAKKRMETWKADRSIDSADILFSHPLIVTCEPM